MSIYRKLNNYDYTNLKSIKQFLESMSQTNDKYEMKYPNRMSQANKHKFYDQFHEFELKDDNIFYQNLMVIPKQKENK